MRLCREVRSVTVVDNYYRVETNAFPFRIYMMTDHMIRIRACVERETIEASYCLVKTAWEDLLDDVLSEERERVQVADSTLTELEDCWLISGNALRIEVQKKPFVIRILSAGGEVLYEDLPDIGWSADANGRRIHRCIYHPGDRFYGFGEQTGAFDKAESAMPLDAKDCFSYNAEKTDCMYKHIPFYIRLENENRHATGYFYHNTFPCDFNMGKERSNYWQPHSRYRTDGGDIDLFWMDGPAIRDVVRAYTWLTGTGAMLPRYALGYLGSSMYYPELEKDCDQAILSFADTAKEEGIPMDAFMLSSGYCNIETAEGLKRCVFTWNEKRFPDPAGFMAQMNEKQIPVVPNVKPGVLRVHPAFRKWAADGLFVKDAEEDQPADITWWGGKGAMADLTSPKVRAAWKELLKEQVLLEGTSAVWNDNCEYDGITDLDSRCDFEGIGAPVQAMKPVMSNLMCMATREAIAETSPESRPLIVCRAGFAGIQRYVQSWSGDNRTDWASLKSNIATMLNMSLSGVANYGSDVGGFGGIAPEEELFVRWVQNGIFMPRFSIHSVNSDNTVTEPWMYSGTKHLIRDAVHFRYRLSPYLYSLIARAHREGLPIMEPLCSAFQDDPACDREGVHFMLGDALLVANVVEKGQTEKRIYLPKGARFYDFHTRQCYEGGQEIVFTVTLDSIPLFLRGGSILPLLEQTPKTLHGQMNGDLRLVIAPDADCSFMLYEDDGESNAYLDGAYLDTRIDVLAGEETVIRFTREGNYASGIRNLILDVIHGENSPYDISVSGHTLPRFLHREAFEKATEGWYYSMSMHAVLVRFPAPKGDFEVRMIMTRKDLLGM